MTVLQRIVRRLRRGASNAPPVICISIPKSGTNLLERTLSTFPQLRHNREYEHVRGEPDEALLRREMAKVGRCEYMMTHLVPLPHIREVVREAPHVPLFIRRDPRAVAVSLVHYAAHMRPDVGSHRDLVEDYPDDAARLMAVITGRAGRSIAGFYERYLPWLDEPGVLELTFEDLVGERGGGSEEAQRRTARRIADHLGVTLTEADLDYTVREAFWPESPTFRRGRIDDWREHFTEEHTAAFQEVAGDLLVRLGYESGTD